MSVNSAPCAMRCIDPPANNKSPAKETATRREFMVLSYAVFQNRLSAHCKHHQRRLQRYGALSLHRQRVEPGRRCRRNSIDGRFPTPDSEIRIILRHSGLRTSESKDTSNLLL